MRLLKAECKRVMKTRAVWFLLAAALSLSFIMAYFPMSFMQYSYMDKNGEQVTITGRKAIAIIKEKQAVSAGAVTPDKIKAALETYQACVEQYGPTAGGDFPLNVYNEKILPVEAIIHVVREVNADSKTGIAPDIMEIDPENAQRFYEQCSERLDSLMDMEQKEHPDARRKAKALYAEVEQPYEYYPGFNKDATDYLILYLLLLEFICVLLAAPIFSSDYQTKADDIQRCAKYGRIRLAVARVIVMLLISTLTVTAGVTIFLSLTKGIFGAECLKSSIQMLYSAVSLSNLDLGQMLLIGAGVGLLTITAAVLCTLMISSRCRSVSAAAIAAMVICLLPIVIGQMSSGNLAGWIRCILPTGGLGLGSCFLYELFDFNFIYLGSSSFWIPHVILAVLAVEIPLFFVLTVCFHNRYIAK